MEKIRVLTLIHATSQKQHLASLIIHLNHTPHHPLAFGDLIFHLAGAAVIKIEVVPAIAFGHPDDFLTVVQVMAIFFAGVEKESRTLFIDQSSSRAARRVHLDYPINLVAPLVVFKSESPAVFPPGKVRKVEGIRKERPVNIYLLFTLNQEKNRLFDVEWIARLGIAKGEIFWLQLVSR